MKIPPELKDALLARDGRHEGREIRFRCLYPENHRNGDANPSARYHRDKHVWCCDVCKNHGGWKELCDLLGVEYHQPSSIAATYRYTDEDGRLLFETVRKVPKDFRQRRPDGAGGWIWSLKGVRRVLYRLPEVTAAVAEGRVGLLPRAASLGPSAVGWCESEVRQWLESRKPVEWGNAAGAGGS